MFIQEVQTSDALDSQLINCDNSFLFNDIKYLHEQKDSLNVLAKLMANLSFQRPTDVFRLIECLQKENDEIDYKRGMKSDHCEGIQVKQSRKLSECDIQTLEIEKVEGKQKTIKSQNKNIYQQHKYQTVILPNLVTLYLEKDMYQYNESESMRKSKDESNPIEIIPEREQNEKSQMKELELGNKYLTLENRCSTQIRVVQSSITSISSILTKISSYRSHTKVLLSLSQKKKFKITQLYQKKKNFKNYLEQLANLKKLVSQKVHLSLKQVGENNSSNSEISEDEKQLTEFRCIESLMQKYQYVPYVFLETMLEKKLGNIIEKRIARKVETRFLNLSIDRVLQVWKRIVNDYLTKSSSNRLSLSQLTTNFLHLVIYVKPDSFQCTEQELSQNLSHQFQTFLQQKYIEFSFTKLNETIKIQQFQKICSMMQFSQFTRAVLQKFKYLWTKIYSEGVRQMVAIFDGIMGEDQDRNDSLSDMNEKGKKRKNHVIETREENNEEKQKYGGIGETVRVINKLIISFSPKYAWIQQYLAQKNEQSSECSKRPLINLLVQRLFAKILSEHRKINSKLEKQLVSKTFNFEFKGRQFLSLTQKYLSPKEKKNKSSLSKQKISSVSKQQSSNSIESKKKVELRTKKKTSFFGTEPKQTIQVEMNGHVFDGLKSLSYETVERLGVKRFLNEDLDENTMMKQQFEIIEYAKNIKHRFLGNSSNKISLNPFRRDRQTIRQRLIQLIYQTNFTDISTQESDEFRVSIVKLVIESVIGQNRKLIQDDNRQLLDMCMRAKRQLKIEQHIQKSLNELLVLENFQEQKKDSLSEEITQKLKKMEEWIVKGHNLRDVSMRQMIERVVELLLVLYNHYHNYRQVFFSKSHTQIPQQKGIQLLNKLIKLRFSVTRYLLHLYLILQVQQFLGTDSKKESKSKQKQKFDYIISLSDTKNLEDDNRVDCIRVDEQLLVEVVQFMERGFWIQEDSQEQRKHHKINHSSSPVASSQSCLSYQSNHHKTSPNSHVHTKKKSIPSKLSSVVGSIFGNSKKAKQEKKASQQQNLNAHQKNQRTNILNGVNLLKLLQTVSEMIEVERQDIHSN